MTASVTVHGDNGTLNIEHIVAGSERGVRIRCVRPGEPAFQSLSLPSEFGGELAVDDFFGPFRTQSVGPRHFVEAIRDDLHIPMSFLDGWRVQQAIDAALRSDLEGRCVALEH